jgi:hypothetical protein
MEWFFAGGFVLSFFLVSVLFLLPKLIRFTKPAKALALQLEKLSKASSKLPATAKAVSIFAEDPVLHLAKRQKLLREARARKRSRERRLRHRDI